MVVADNVEQRQLVVADMLHGKRGAVLLEVVEDQQEAEEDQIHLEERKAAEDCVTMVVVLPCLLSIVSDFVF